MEKTIEKFQFIFLVAGIGFFVLAFIVSGVVTVNALSNLPYTTLDEISQDVDPYFVALSNQYPEQFEKYYPGGPTPENYREALKLARDTYIGEACWHCHSQQVRPVANEDVRFGPVSTAAEQQHELMMPQLMGTRRVGPDLSREGGYRSNDWHVAHFYNPRSVAPTSVMPSYTWFFDGQQPNKKGLAMIAYMQWLGTNVER
ncbi:MAG: cbb3-type cytochrome c oxidase subunit II [Anaerolineae bacterium]|nr:cbb3-type cytochrome c oxidase subunit II [Anaerolineae bacterium]